MSKAVSERARLRSYDLIDKAALPQVEKLKQLPAIVSEFLSDDSIQVIQHFGLEAPDKLNTYYCALEDALGIAMDRLIAAERKLSQLEK